MAISTHGDLVLDVVRAADPAAAEAARAKLANTAAAKSDQSEFSVSETRPANAPVARSAKEDAFTKFEAMVLQTFIQQMMPQDTKSVYGEGMAGEMWQSMLAEQIAKQVAERGGIGIADRIIRPHYEERERNAALQTQNSVAAPSSVEAQMQSVALIQEIQHKLANALNEDRSVAANAAN